MASLLGNQVAAGISGYGEFAEQIKAGKLRLLAISADQRQPGIDAPTLKEQGVDIELFNWRGVFAPPGVTEEQKAAMVTLIETMAKTPRGRTSCKKRDWTPIMLTGDRPTRSSSKMRQRASRAFSRTSGSAYDP